MRKERVEEARSRKRRRDEEDTSANSVGGINRAANARLEDSDGNDVNAAS